MKSGECESGKERKKNVREEDNFDKKKKNSAAIIRNGPTTNLRIIHEDFLFAIGQRHETVGTHKLHKRDFTVIVNICQ